ncbi:MAG: amidohydrolase family protein, partial [Candidatus Omnitrophica bacterium]|nr:amidohydrolase family protein [Candidatus Omnitrophota bacterium]
MRGIPDASEVVMVGRDILLAELTGARLHIAHVSTKDAVRLIKDAKKRGIKITAETCPHYFTLSDDEVKSFNTSFRVNPPLRSKDDIKAIKDGLKDGSIDVIATDHAPHADAEKDVEFDKAPCGMIGLETALPLAIEGLIEQKIIDWKALISQMSGAPAGILGLKDKGSLAEGADADVAIIDPEAEWVYEKAGILSKSKNSPFIGKTLKGKVLYTICGGKVVYTDA